MPRLYYVLPLLLTRGPVRAPVLKYYRRSAERPGMDKDLPWDLRTSERSTSAQANGEHAGGSRNDWLRDPALLCVYWSPCTLIRGPCLIADPISRHREIGRAFGVDLVSFGVLVLFISRFQVSIGFF